MALTPLFTAGPLDPDGTPQVSPEPTTLLLDDYSQGITAYHTTGGTAPTISNGLASTAEGTTASAVSYVRSTLPYSLRAQTNLRIAHIVTIEASATANNTRWWGYGQNQSSPTSAAPVLNGAVWLLDAANNGAMAPVIFSNGNKTTVSLKSGVTLTRDANPHRYQIDYRQSRIDWSVDGVVVATLLFPQLAVATGMYEIWGSANASTAPSAHTFQISSSTVGDLGANNNTISDGANPGIQATVRGASTGAAAATDSALAVTLRDAVPAGSNNIGNVGVSFLPSLNSGTNSIGTVGLNAGSATIGSIASILSSVVPGTAATNLGKARSGTAGTTDTGVAMLGVRAPATPAAAASAQGAYAPIALDAEGKMIVADGADPVNTWQGNVTQTTTTAAPIKAAAAAGIRNYLTDLSITNSSATAVVVQILDGTTVIWQQALAATTGSIHRSFKTPLRSTAAAALNVNISAAASNVYFSAEGFVGV